MPDGFDPNASSDVYSIVVQTDGKILIGGLFTTLNGGMVSRNRIARLGFTPTAAGVSVAGRVRTPNGRGLSNAYVTLTDADGNQRLARTTAFGYFHFEDVAAGETYIVGVSSKRYRFAPQVLSINQDISDVELTGEDIFGSSR